LGEVGDGDVAIGVDDDVRLHWEGNL
jgi:hypothetical protein